MQSLTNMLFTAWQGTQPIMSQADPTVPARSADAPLLHDLTHLWPGYFLIQFKCLCEKLDHFLVGIILHGLFTSLVKIFYRLQQGLIVPLCVRGFGGLRPMMSQKRVIGFDIFFVGLLDPFGDRLM